MRFSLSFLLILSSIYICTAQDISVKSFREIANDMDARAYHKKIDQNNEVCAIIKVVTTQTGFDFDVGSLGVVEVVQKKGEIWVYVPRGVQYITISHSQLGVLRQHPLGIPIKAATVYELVLITGKVTTVIEEPEIKTQWLVITSEPEGADVFIDNIPVDKTPFSKKYREGQYDYRVELPRYHPQAGRVLLKGEEKRFNLTLKPKFGSIQVTSTPESGMEIFLNEVNTGKVTPATIDSVTSGEYTLQLRSSWYVPQAKSVTVRDDDTTHVDFQMEPAFANVTINAKPNANILIEGERKGSTKWDSRMMMGVYDLKIEKDKHKPHIQDLVIIPGKDVTIDIELEPRMGELNISVKPIGAKISIDGEYKGEAPKTIELLIGDYNLTLEKAGYGTINKKITITENQELDIIETLSSGLEVTIETTPPGALLYINGKHQGTTPQKVSLKYGDHKIKVVNRTKVVEETINIKQGGQNKWRFDVVDGKEISISSRPSGAKLSIDGREIGTTPQNIYLTFGSHEIKFEYNGKKKSRNINVTKYYNNDISESLYDCDTYVPITSNVDGADVYVDGSHVGKTPVKYHLTDKRSSVEIKKKGYISYRSSLICGETLPKVYLEKKPTLFDKFFKNKIEHQFNYRAGSYSDSSKTSAEQGENMYKLSARAGNYQLNYKLLKAIILINSFTIEKKSITKLYVYDHTDNLHHNVVNSSVNGFYFSYNPSIALNIDFFRLSFGYTKYFALKTNNDLLSKSFGGFSFGFAFHVAYSYIVESWTRGAFRLSFDCNVINPSHMGSKSGVFGGYLGVGFVY